MLLWMNLLKNIGIKLVISRLSIKINKQQLLELIEKITSKATTHNSKCDLLVLPWMPYWTH